MENQNLTIESFFLNDYAKIKEEKENLEKELFELKEHVYKTEQMSEGFVDLKTPIKLIYIDVNLSNYKLFGDDGSLCDKTIEQLQEIISKSQEEIAEYLTNLKVYSYSKALNIKERNFPFTLKFTTYKGTEIFAYDPDYEDNRLIKFKNDAAINCWVVADFKDECIRYAVKNFIEFVNERINELRAENQSESA